MNTLRRHSRQERAHFLALDKNDRPFLLAVIRARHNAAQNNVPQLIEFLTESNCKFGLFADFDKILIFERAKPEVDSPILTLPTSDVLTPYEPEFNKKRIFHYYFRGLIEAWLRDLGSHWRCENPPFFEEMEAIGLTRRLVGGITRAGRKS